jgi:hypothetical protein
MLKRIAGAVLLGGGLTAAMSMRSTSMWMYSDLRSPRWCRSHRRRSNYDGRANAGATAPGKAPPSKRMILRNG